jgi:hypothetical protein
MSVESGSSSTWPAGDRRARLGTQRRRRFVYEPSGAFRIWTSGSQTASREETTHGYQKLIIRRFDVHIHRTEGLGFVAHCSAALLINALNHYEGALAAAERACEYPLELGFSIIVPPEFIEAASRSGRADLAREALDRLAEPRVRPDPIGRLGWKRVRQHSSTKERSPNALSRGDRTPHSSRPPHGAGPCPASVRRMALSRAPPCGCPRGATGGPRVVRRDRSPSPRRADPP